MPATAAAALAAAAVKGRGEDDVALLDGEVGLVGLDRVAVVIQHLEKKKKNEKGDREGGRQGNGMHPAVTQNTGEEKLGAGA